jgi:hypothetical protein
VSLPNPRAQEFARQFEEAQFGFIELVESLTEEQWRRVGSNFPQRFNDEDESRTVGVIAHHVAVSGPWIMDRIQAMVEGRPLTPPNIQSANAAHATQHSDVTREEVIGVLRESRPALAAAVRAIADDQLDQQRDTPVGPMSVAQRIERVLIGHLMVHRGSIETAILGSDPAQ